MNEHIQVKTIGSNGQISLGKEFAGKMVLIDQVDQGTWIIKTGGFIPDSEKWLYQGDNLSKLEQALAWAERTDPQDSFESFMQGIDDRHV